MKRTKRTSYCEVTSCEFADDVVRAAAAEAATLALVQVRVGLVEAEGAVVGTTPPGDEAA